MSSSTPKSSLPHGTKVLVFGDFEDQCEILANGSGVLNTYKYPDLPGINEFEGKLMHSAAWDGSYDLKGKTVAVIGGGSSAVQIVPNIQPGKFYDYPPSSQKVTVSVVGKLIPFLRSSVWITTGFGAKYAGPGGTNFECKKSFALSSLHSNQQFRYQ
jgi:hypothetical protein